VLEQMTPSYNICVIVLVSVNISSRQLIWSPACSLQSVFDRRPVKYDSSMERSSERLGDILGIGCCCLGL